MKKVLFLSILSLFLLTGCGKTNKTLTCTGTTEEDGIKVSMELKANVKNDKIMDASAKMIFNDETTASSMCGIFALANSMVENDEEKIDYECKDKTITFKNYFQMIEEQDKKEYTRDEFIKLMEEENLTCK